MRIAALALLLAAPAVRADDWPQWLGPKRDGVWRETGLLDSFPPGGPKVEWRKPVGQGYAGPAVSGGRVFVTDRVLAAGAKDSTNPFSKDKVEGTERVHALDEATGDTLWKHEYPCTYTVSYAAGPRCTPTADGGRVYTLGAMGDLFAFDAAKGTVLWSKNFLKDYEASLPVWGFASHPLVDGDKLICLVGGSNDRLVVAFDKATGKELWASQSCPGDFGYCPPMIYEFGGRRQLIVWHAKAVVGLDPETGKRLWAVPFASNYALTAPTPRKVGDDGLFVTSFYHGAMLLKVNADKAEVVWKSKAKNEKPAQTTDLSSIIATPFVEGGTVYGVDSYGELRGLEAATGKRLWTTMAATRGAMTPAKVAEGEGPAESERWSNAFIVKNEGRYFLFNEQGDLITARLTPKGYEEVSRAHLIDPTNTLVKQRGKVLWMHPAFADKSAFVRNDADILRVNLAK